jgi:hypothetical protein
VRAELCNLNYASNYTKYRSCTYSVPIGAGSVQITLCTALWQIFSQPQTAPTNGKKGLAVDYDYYSASGVPKNKFIRMNLV